MSVGHRSYVGLAFRRLLTLFFVAILLLVTLIVAVTSFGVFKKVARQSHVMQTVFSEAIAEDVLSGALHQVFHRCEQIFKLEQIEYVRVENSVGEEICHLTRSGIETNIVSPSVISFDSSDAEIAARVYLKMSRSEDINRLVALSVVLAVSLMVFSVFLFSYLKATVKRTLSPVNDFANKLRQHQLADLPQAVQQFETMGIEEMNALKGGFCQLLGEIENYQRDLVQKTREASAARLTQMLAHDVRKPFSSVRLTLDLLLNTPPEQVPEVLRQCIPEVEQALASVNGMIEDVMQVGTEVKLHCESVSFSSLLRSSLVELSHVFPNAEINFRYHADTDKCLLVDTRRAGRVFSNIIGNAYQAMNLRGQMWFEMHECPGGWCEITIGNSGSFIPSDSLEKLFDAFFTSGKRDGTGLGLAIAKKIVEAHKGMIFCRSQKSLDEPEGSVEFVMRLPLSADRIEATERLEESSQEIVASQRVAINRGGEKQLKVYDDPDSNHVARDVEAQLRDRSSPLLVLIVEDEAIYRNHLTSLLEPFPKVFAQVAFKAVPRATDDFFRNSKEASLVILDVDLGRGERNGLELAQHLRMDGFRGQICIHSNRYPGDDAREAFQAGADAVFPKPMSAVHLLKLIRAATERHRSSDETLAPEEQRLRIAHVDDQLIFRLAWKRAFGKEARVEISSFDSPESLLKEASLSQLDAVFTDYHFSPVSEMSGLDLAREIHELAPLLPVYLTSNGSFSDRSFGGLFSGILDKGVPDEVKLRELVSSHRKADSCSSS